MSASLSAFTANPHIQLLERVMSEATEPIECLVIAHNDPRMLSTLSSALVGERTAVLEVSQDLWDFEGGELSETIEWAIKYADIRQLVLAGHTLAGGPQSRASLVTSASRSSTQNGYSKLLAGVQLNNSRSRAAQDRFALQVQQLLQFPLVRRRCSSGETSVFGLLYRAEGGLFLAYDAAEDEFHPLTPKY